MGDQTFTISPVTSKDEFDDLCELAVSYHQLFPEDAAVLGNALTALEQNRSSLLGVGRINEDKIAFFILGLDAEPTLQAIYVPPDLRNFRLGSSLFVNMATVMHVESIERVSLVAWGRNIRFFERLGARSVDGRPDMNGTRRMTFAPDDLTRPTGWFEKNMLPTGE
ncbi:MAG: hypothetical protein HYU58_04550 [Proteobacteria bacterium]|nr:hypothetical protein [Pseudomonadota bacterium]